MQKLKWIVLASFLIILRAEAALPPLYQTSSEIKAIMEDIQLGQKLQSGESIEKIEKNDQGYLITTNKSQLQVKVTYQPAQQPGPVSYQLHFDDSSALTK